ncbi:MAG: alanine--tRNA ligase [Nanoarchaeota archaeon]|nr:alanine--tRNA ligase [Nanoarchaeota archaeon]MBU1030554.1 alanine--tRNA ligase [Nanoarchaeota archaeon]MBU1850539.1 alanine--tRNA ligase [Nanoarchaeota archaeon]
MISDKEIKKKFKPIFWKNPDKFYPTDVLRSEGFERKICPSCKKPFWTTTNRVICGDPACSNEFGFIGKSPAKNSLSYVEVWTKFSKMFKKFGYTPINRYPVVSRWNPTMEYTNASIAAFQPYVISGEIKPPANPLIIPQFCLRFGDVDNVGITGSHNTGFVMIGQHMFVPPADWDQNEVFRHIHSWIKNGLGLSNDEVTFHEDAWAGGGNFGCCMEFFSRGCELGNQVYMLYEQTNNGYKELNMKVLDMGMGQERNAWFSQGTNTMYDAIFPTIIKKLLQKTGVNKDDDLFKRFVPYSGLLNLDETENINKSWSLVAKKVGVSVSELKSGILPMSEIYSVAEHSRSLLFALNDGALPSNVGGGYNLRMLLRRTLGFIDKNDWNLSIPDICSWHASYLKKIFPELSQNLDGVSEILNVEKRKYFENKKRSKQIISQVIKTDVSEKKLLELYDSQGVNPEQVKSEAAKIGKKIVIPENFYAKLSELHEHSEQKTQTRKSRDVPVSDVLDTKALYFDSYDYVDFKSVVLKVIDNMVVLEKTAFYPTSGGQLHDIGTINGVNVVDVFKEGGVIVHVLEKKPSLSKNNLAVGKIDISRRLQLAQHHTATHILNGACKKILGKHVWQAGASKSEDKARLDITHYDQLTDEQVKKIGSLANEIVRNNLPVYKSFLPRDIAEAKYGFTIYQGGAVPGKKLRIVEIPGFDVEACGGTHLNLTGECKSIKILKTSKVQDGVIRIEFASGGAASSFKKEEDSFLSESAKILLCEKSQVPFRAQELFEKWKIAKKTFKKKREINISELELVSKKSFSGDALTKTAEILNTQPEHVPKTLKRFFSELESLKKSLNKVKNC